jgi:hypothetical protein
MRGNGDLLRLERDLDSTVNLRLKGTAARRPRNCLTWHFPSPRKSECARPESTDAMLETCRVIFWSRQRPGVLLWFMSLAYRIVFTCPNGHNINLQKKCDIVSLSEDVATKMFGNEQLSCLNGGCGWHGKASDARLIRILPFNWILSPVS